MRPKTKNWMLKFGLVMFRHKSTWLDQEKIMCWLKTPAYVAAKCPDVSLKTSGFDIPKWDAHIYLTYRTSVTSYRGFMTLILCSSHFL